MNSQGRACAGITHPGEESFTLLAVLNELAVCGGAHEGNEFIAVTAEHRLSTHVSLRVAAAVPIQIMAPGAPGTPVVLGDDDDVPSRAIGHFFCLIGAPHGYLPAHLRLRFHEGDALTLREMVECTAIATGEIPRVVEDARPVNDPRSPFLLTDLDDRTVLLGDLLVLPHLPGQFLGPGHHAGLIIGIAEVCSKGAAAGVGSVRVDAFAAPSEYARVVRREPRQIAAESLTWVVWIVKFHPRAGEVERNFCHCSTLGVTEAGSVSDVRLGVLDVGSNTVHLLIVDAHYGAAPLPAHKVKTTLRLAEHLDADGCIDESAVESLVEFIRQSLAVAEDLGVTEILAFATSAIRDAPNGSAVLAAVQERTGVSLDLLSGEEEARLTYLAVRRWWGWSAGRILMVDIGGGSLEIASGADEEPDVVVSLPLGAGRLTRQFCSDDPPHPDQVRALRRHARTVIAEYAGRITRAGEPRLCVATSKTMRQLARIGGAAASGEGFHVRRILERESLRSWVPQLAGMTAAERTRLPGVSESRAPQLVAGAVVAESVMDILDIPALDIGPWALREGVILRRLDSLGP